MAQSNAVSILGIIALIAVIVAAVYFIVDEADDNDLEIDIGLVTEAPNRAVAGSVAAAIPFRFVEA